MNQDIIDDEKNYLTNQNSKRSDRFLGRVLSARQIEPNLYQERYNYLKKQVFGKC